MACAHTDGFEVVQQGASAVPRHPITALNDIVAMERRERYEDQIDQPEARGVAAVRLDDVLEDRLRVIDQVHLVHGDRNMGYAEERSDEPVASGL